MNIKCNAKISEHGHDALQMTESRARSNPAGRKGLTSLLSVQEVASLWLRTSEDVLGTSYITFNLITVKPLNYRTIISRGDLLLGPESDLEF